MWLSVNGSAPLSALTVSLLNSRGSQRVFGTEKENGFRGLWDSALRHQVSQLPNVTREPPSSGPRFAGGIFGGFGTGVGDEGEVLEEAFALVFGEDLEDFALEGDGDFADLGVGFTAMGEQANAVGAAITLVGEAFEESVALHPFKEGGDGVGIAADDLGDVLLGHSFFIGLDEGAEDGELVRGDAGVDDAAAEGLVEAVPGAAEQKRKATALGSINGEDLGSCGFSGRHDATGK